MSVMDVWVFSAPGDRDNWVASALVDVPYAAVLQQLSRHRSFSLSVGSSRVMELSLDFKPIWRTQPQGKMFSQGFPSLTQLIIAKSVWRMARAINYGLSRIMRTAGIHKQHYSLQ
ncbi:MAG: hypothetical protein KatS3mg054_0078 [Chloroflexus sp.]|nr:MAG: hypothetical protein KatS3mg054_0078 [Chloroflexus sp.]